ncbi:unnamed protein product [Arabidopsis halleri]
MLFTNDLQISPNLRLENSVLTPKDCCREEEYHPPCPRIQAAA